jgi:hypothetical protein
MATSQQITGMQGVYLVAAELSERGFIVSPTSRGAAGADLLVTDQKCRRAYTVQVKTNKRTFGFWLVGKKAREIISKTHIYALVNIKKYGKEIEYYIVPSKIIAENMQEDEKGNWHSFSLEQAKIYKDQWKYFGDSAG